MAYVAAMRVNNHGRQPWRDLLRPFARIVVRRLVNGASAYGDRSLTTTPGELMRELAEEASDLACWGYLLWRRLEHLRRELDHATVCPLCGAATTPVLPAREQEVVL